MPTLIGGVPLFDFFEQNRLHISRTAVLQPSHAQVGTLTQIADLDALLPAPHWRVEIERERGCEQVRVINGINGVYRSCHGPNALPLIAELDRRTAELYLPEIPAFPPDIDIDEKGGVMWTSILQYDAEGERILPAIKFQGIINDHDAFERQTRLGMLFLSEGCVGVVNRKTGDVWQAGESVERRERERIEGSACHRAGRDESETEGSGSGAASVGPRSRVQETA